MISAKNSFSWQDILLIYEMNNSSPLGEFLLPFDNSFPGLAKQIKKEPIHIVIPCCKYESYGIVRWV